MHPAHKMLPVLKIFIPCSEFRDKTLTIMDAVLYAMLNEFGNDCNFQLEEFMDRNGSDGWLLSTTSFEAYKRVVLEDKCLCQVGEEKIRAYPFRESKRKQSVGEILLTQKRYAKAGKSSDSNEEEDVKSEQSTAAGKESKKGRLSTTGTDDLKKSQNLWPKVVISKEDIARAEQVWLKFRKEKQVRNRRFRSANNRRRG